VSKTEDLNPKAQAYVTKCLRLWSDFWSLQPCVGCEELMKLKACVVHSLIEVAIEKGIFHIELMDQLGVGGGNAEDGLNHCRFHYRTEHLNIFDVKLL
jgi:hypothetical protein